MPENHEGITIHIIGFKSTHEISVSYEGKTKLKFKKIGTPEVNTEIGLKTVIV